MDRSKLLERLELVATGLENNNLIPAYNFIYCDGKRMYAGHDSFTVVIEDNVPHGTFAVHGPTLITLLKAIKSGDVTFAVNGDHLDIKGGQTEYNIPIKGKEAFIWQEPSLVNDYEYFGLVQGIRGALSTCSSDQALVNFNRVTFANHNGNIAVYTCDGDALTRYVTDNRNGSKTNFWVPKSFCEAILKMPDTNNVGLTVGAEWVMARHKGVAIYGRNHGTPTMDYEKWINQTTKGENPSSTFPATMLKPALERAAAVTKLETKPTLLIFNDKALQLVTTTIYADVVDMIKRVDHEECEVWISADKWLATTDGCTLFKAMPNCTVFSGANFLRIVGNLSEVKNVSGQQS